MILSNIAHYRKTTELFLKCGQNTIELYGILFTTLSLFSSSLQVLGNVMNQFEINSRDPNNSGQFLSECEREYLEKTLKEDLPKQYYQRISIMLLADEGQTQTQICQELGCCQSTARYWMDIAKSGQAHQWNQKKIGRPKAVSEEYVQRLRELVSKSPREVKIPYRDFTYSTRQWTAKKLSEHLGAELGVQLSDRHINRLLKKIGLSTKPQPTNKTPIVNTKIVIGDLNSDVKSEPSIALLAPI